MLNIKNYKTFPMDIGISTGNGGDGHNQLTDSSKQWEMGIWVGHLIRIINGTGTGQTRKIINSNAQTITVNETWYEDPDTSSEYIIIQKIIDNIITDEYGFDAENTPNNELRVITPYRLVGSTFHGSTLDTNFWTSSLGTGGSATIGNGQVILATGTTANNNTSISSNRSARYVGGSSNRFRMVMRLPDGGTANNTRRWGVFTTANGAFFQISGTNFSLVTRKTNSSNDIIIPNGSFNGRSGNSWDVDTNTHIYEIYYRDSDVFFIIDGILIHTFVAPLTTWTDTLTLPVRFENNNSNGSTTDVFIEVRQTGIHRLGKELTQPTSKYQAGTTAVGGINLKGTAGNLHGIVIGGVDNTSAVTLYDGTSTSGAIIWSSGSMPNNTNPFSLDFKGLPFFTGLHLLVATVNSNVTVIYE